MKQAFFTAVINDDVADLAGALGANHALDGQDLADEGVLLLGHVHLHIRLVPIGDGLEEVEILALGRQSGARAKLGGGDAGVRNLGQRNHPQVHLLRRGIPAEACVVAVQSAHQSPGKCGAQTIVPVVFSAIVLSGVVGRIWNCLCLLRGFAQTQSSLPSNSLHKGPSLLEAHKTLNLDTDSRVQNLPCWILGLLFLIAENGANQKKFHEKYSMHRQKEVPDEAKK